MTQQPPTKEQVIQALDQIRQILSNPDITGFTFDIPVIIRNHIEMAKYYVSLSEIPKSDTPKDES